MQLTAKAAVCGGAVALFVGGFWLGTLAGCAGRPGESLPVPEPIPPMAPLADVAAGARAQLLAVREEPARFAPDTHLPNMKELLASLPLNPSRFSPGRDLTYIDDPRVKWESDTDRHDDEDDHTIHRALEAPLRRLIELVHRNGGRLIVQESYRPDGVHNNQSLHKEGRAVDVTCEGMTYERLAKLCWAAGFDWVYYERSTKTGAHVHCSVRP